jgi:hypothetical protein
MPPFPKPPSRRRPRSWVRPALLALAVLSTTAGSGCVLAGWVAAGAKELQETRPRKVEAAYKGLEGKSFAVVVSCDRAVQADHPGVMEELTARITERLEQNAGAKGRIRADRLLAYLYDNPRWVAMSPSDLARRLGVDRLVYIELLEYQLNDPGNQYLWKGVAAGRVGVIEADGLLPDEFAFEREVRVSYPDEEGYGQSDYDGTFVASVLIQRFTDRASWLFYTHEEKGKMEY